MIEPKDRSSTPAASSAERRPRSHESVEEKAVRYLREGRLTIERVDGPLLLARCHGGATYLLEHDDERGWRCSCPARRRCCHLAALQLVTRTERDERGLS